MNGRERVLAMLRGEAVDRFPNMPITMMFAADAIGRPYGEYATDCRVMAEGQIRVAETCDVDHVSGISDPAREAADCGAAIEFFPDQPPAIAEDRALLRDKTVLARLRQPDPLGGGRMHDRVKAVAIMAERVGRDKLVEGWIEGPCAQGADLRGINALMLDFFDDPGFVTDLFAFIIELETNFARAQVEAGAELIGLGDAAASLVGPELYREFVWAGEHRLIQSIHAMGALVRLHICGNTNALLADMARLGADMIDLDYPVDITRVRAAMGARQVVAANICPVDVVRNGTPALIHAGLEACRAALDPAFIVAAGCEIPRDTPQANMLALAEFARTHRPSH